MLINADAAAPIGGTGSSMKLAFTWCNTDMDFSDQNELTEYFQLVPEHWGIYEPVSWWGVWKANSLIYHSLLMIL